MAGVDERPVLHVGQKHVYNSFGNQLQFHFDITYPLITNIVYVNLTVKKITHTILDFPFNISFL